MDPTYPELTLRDYMRVLFRQKAVVITCFVTVMATVAVGLQMKTPVFESRVKLLISAEKQTESIFYRDLATGYRAGEAALTQSEIVTSNPVVERAVRATGLSQRPMDYELEYASKIKKPVIRLQLKFLRRQIAKYTDQQRQAFLFRSAVEELKSKVKVEPVRDTNIFTISVRDYSQVGAAILANVVSRSYLIFDLEQQLAELQLKYGEKHQAFLQLKDYIEKMAKNLTGEPLSNIDAIGPASVKVVEQAQVPIRPIGPQQSLILLLAFFMSLFLGVMLAFAFEYMDQTFKSPQEIESFLRVPFLGSIPQNATAHNYRTLAEQVFLVMKDKSLKTLVIGATRMHEGTTATVTNLGTYLAKNAGHKVLIIDANLRSPGVYKFPKAGEGQGLAEVLEDKIPFDKAIKDVGNNLHVLPAGKTALNPLTLLDSNKMFDILKASKERYEIVLIDVPEFGAYTDGFVLAEQSDAVAVVIIEGKTRKQVVRAAIQPFLEQKEPNVIGAILNRRQYVIPKMIYDRI